MAKSTVLIGINYVNALVKRLKITYEKVKEHRANHILPQGHGEYSLLSQKGKEA